MFSRNPKPDIREPQQQSAVLGAGVGDGVPRTPECMAKLSQLQMKAVPGTMLHNSVPTALLEFGAHETRSAFAVFCSLACDLFLGKSTVFASVTLLHDKQNFGEFS